MMVPVLISLLFGMVLGQRFRVLVVLPAIGLAWMVVISIGIVRGDAAWPIILLAVAVSVGLQIGYLVGIGIRVAMVTARASRLHAAARAGSVPTRRRTLY
jgi:hypothetical protein